MFEAIHRGKPDQKLLAYQYLQVLPQIAQGDSNKLWIIPSELTEALKGIGRRPRRRPARPRQAADGGRVGRHRRAHADAFDDTVLEDPATALAEAARGRPAAPAPRPRATRPDARRAAAAEPRPGPRRPTAAGSRAGAGRPAAPRRPPCRRRRRAASDGPVPRPRGPARGLTQAPAPGHPVTLARVAGCPSSRSSRHAAPPGVGAGTINTVVGSGTLITFPTLLLFGYPAGRRQRDQQHRPGARRADRDLGLPAPSCAATGARCAASRRCRSSARSIGALLLLRAAGGGVRGDRAGAHRPRAACWSSFGPRLQTKAAARHADAERDAAPARTAGCCCCGRHAVRRDVRRLLRRRPGGAADGPAGRARARAAAELNAIKNVLALVVNAVAAVTFMVVAWDAIDWPVAADRRRGRCSAGCLGARVGGGCPRAVLRALIVLIGVVAIAKMVVVG